MLYTNEEAALFLGISPASISNWVRLGLLSETQGRIQQNDLKLLKLKMDSGEIGRLHKRANKSRSRNRFIPSEYISSNDSINKIQEIVEYIKSNNISVEHALFLLAINLFCKSGDIVISDCKDLLNFDNISFKRNCVFKHLREWHNRVLSGEINYHYDKLFYIANCNLPDEKDILGIIYQSILHEGDKSSLGSYYTPSEVAWSLVNGALENNYKVLDPCCGTGQFLLIFSEFIDDPGNIYGFDIDNKAIEIAKTNILLFYKEREFSPHIYNVNSLLIHKLKYRNFFDFIATNPPWGARYDKQILSDIKMNFSEIRSKESFSFFICQAYRFLKENGTMGFVLPESITNVKVHRDIRKFIAEKTSIQQINILGRKFKKVFSSVITLQLKKKITHESVIDVVYGETRYPVKQSRFLKNKNTLFDIYINRKDLAIFSKIEAHESLSLEHNCEWALGIVTGDNNRFVKEKSDNNKDGEPVYIGSDIEPYHLKAAKYYIHFNPDQFQQTAPPGKYRAPEKLIYKFISANLVFAYDNRQCLTLNSANILIPHINNYPVKVVLAFLNSQLFNYYFKKKFNSIKVLRGYIEQLPLPVLTETEMIKIEELVEGILKKGNSGRDLDRYIFSLYSLADSEIEHIVSCLDS